MKKINYGRQFIDHHDIYKPYPNCNCLINPKKECDYNEFDYYINVWKNLSYNHATLRPGHKMADNDILK